jgi:hypothetical protein
VLGTIAGGILGIPGGHIGIITGGGIGMGIGGTYIPAAICALQICVY